MKQFLILAAAILLALLPLACSKTYTLAPLSVPTVTATPTLTFTPTATIPCAVPQVLVGTPPSGIVIYGSVLSGQSYGTPQEEVMVDLLVDGSADSTAVITASGPGFSVPVPYSGTAITGGNTYALYEYTSSGVSLTVGDTYTLNVSTVVGAASASAVLPPMPSVAPDGSGGSWTGPGQYNFGLVRAVARVTETFYQSACTSSGSIAIPASAYPDSENYVIEFGSENYTTTLAGGQGYWLANSANIIEISK